MSVSEVDTHFYEAKAAIGQQERVPSSNCIAIRYSPNALRASSVLIYDNTYATRNAS